MSRAKSAFWGSVSSQVFMIITMLLTVVITPLVLKFLDKEEYGIGFSYSLGGDGEGGFVAALC